MPGHDPPGSFGAVARRVPIAAAISASSGDDHAAERHATVHELDMGWTGEPRGGIMPVAN